MNISVEQIITDMAQARETQLAKVNNLRPKILEAMQKAKIDCIKVDFSGSDDSGCIDSISVVSSPSDLVDWSNPLSRDHPELSKIIEEFCYDYLASTGVDWYNNEGGQGEFVFDLTTVPHSFSCTVDVNIVSQETAHEHTDVL